MSEAPATPPTPHSLPAEIVALIATVVKRTRLRRAERAEIALELTAHFCDGLDSEKSPVELIAAFGDAQSAARGLRTGAIAKRSPMDRALRTTRIAASWCIAAFACVYSLSIAYLYVNAPVISFDITERLTSLLPQVAESERGWPLFKQGLIALADPESPALANTGWQPKQYKDLGEGDGFALPGDPAWTRQGQFLVERSAGFEFLAQAAARPALGYVPSVHTRRDDRDLIRWDESESLVASSFSAFAMLLPQLTLQRTAARLLASDALHAIDDGDGARFLRDISAMLGTANHAEECKYLVSQLVGSSIRSMTCERIIMALEWRPSALSDEHLVQLAQMLRAVPQGAYTVDFDAELLGITDFLQRTYSDDGNGDGWFNPVYGEELVAGLTQLSGDSDPAQNSTDLWRSSLSTILSPVGAAMMASRKETMDLCGSMMRNAEEQSQLPTWQQNFEFEDDFVALVQDGNLAQMKWIIPRLIFPAVGHAAQQRRKGESYAMAAQVAIACTQFHRAHGGVWPTTIEELVPTYLASRPLDQTTGNPLQFEVSDGAPLISSAPLSNRQSPNNSSSHDVAPRWIWFSGNDQLKRWRQSP